MNLEPFAFLGLVCSGFVLLVILAWVTVCYDIATKQEIEMSRKQTKIWGVFFLICLAILA